MKIKYFIGTLFCKHLNLKHVGTEEHYMMFRGKYEKFNVFKCESCGKKIMYKVIK